MGGCSSSQSDDEDVKKKITITFKHRKRAAVKSPGKKKSTKRTTAPVDEPIQQLIMEGFGSRPYSPTLSLNFEVLGTPQVSTTLFTSLVPVSNESALVVSAPFTTLNSLAWRIKRLPCIRKVPLKFEDYGHSIVQSNYLLSILDKFFLNGFKEYYDERNDELDNICTMIPSSYLKKELKDGSWMDTNSWWSDGSDSAVEAVFGKHGHKLMDAREARTLIFIVHHISHFTLFVGYVDERQWEFYNSMAGDRRLVRHASKIVAWLNEEYNNFRWSNPYLWSWLVKTDIPCQQNGNDCGIFALAFTEHRVHRRNINFTQKDISYFRSKIVVEIFKRSWTLNANRLGLTDLSDFI